MRTIPPIWNSDPEWADQDQVMRYVHQLDSQVSHAHRGGSMVLPRAGGVKHKKGKGKKSRGGARGAGFWDAVESGIGQVGNVAQSVAPALIPLILKGAMGAAV